MRLTHLGQVMHICISKLTITGSDNGLAPVRRQAIIGTNAGILLIGPLGTNFSEILIEIYTCSFQKMHLKMLPGKMAAILSLPQCVKEPSGALSYDMKSKILVLVVTGNDLVSFIRIKPQPFMICYPCDTKEYIDGLEQERHNSSASMD